MTRNALIVLVGCTLCACSHLRSSEALPVATAANKLLFDILANDKICSFKTVLVESRYVKTCDKVKLPIGNATLNVDDPAEFLCLGVYDRTAKLCYLDSLVKVGKSVLPNDASVFDDAVAKFLPKKEQDAFAFCYQWKNPYPPTYQNVTPYVAQLDKAMDKPLLCVKLCTNSAGNFNPLCSVLAAMDNMSMLTLNVSETSPTEKVQETAAKDQIAKTSANVKTSTVAEAISKEVKEASYKSENKAEPPQPKPSDDDKEVTQDMNQGQPPAPPQSQQSEPVPEIAQPVAPPLATHPEETVQNENAKKVEEPKTAAKASQPETNNLSDDKKVEVEAPLPKNPPIVSETGLASMEDRSETHGGPEKGDQPLDDPKIDEISEHTQELEDQDAVGEMGEIEAPVIPPNDEVDESPAVPSEKRDFIHRVPSIRNDDDSHFFGYFTVIGVICIAGYVGYHNKQKIFAMVVEGRRSRGGRGRRRPSTANYRKLDCTLEEAVTSQCNSNVTHVIY